MESYYNGVELSLNQAKTSAIRRAIKTIPDKKLHLVIVTGVDCSSNVVYTNNPWYWKGEQTFEDFVGGVAWDYPNAHNMTLYGVYLINQ